MGENFIAGITAITALIATIINLLSGLGSIKKSEEAKREDAYYKKILIPFLKFYHKEVVGKNAIDFLKEKGVDSTYIPPYIRYVYYNKVESEVVRAKQLQKLLIIDYVKLYDNEDRAINKFIKVIERIEKIFFVIFDALLMCASLFVCFVLVCIMYNAMREKELVIATIVVVTVIIMFVLGFNFLVLFLTKKFIFEDTDMYSTKKSKIDKQISKL